MHGASAFKALTENTVLEENKEEWIEQNKPSEKKNCRPKWEIQEERSNKWDGEGERVKKIIMEGKGITERKGMSRNKGKSTHICTT